MPHSRLPPRSRRGESLTLKSLMIASVLFLGSLVVVAQEFFFSRPAASLSETEAALRLGER